MSRQELAGNNNQVPPGYKQTEVGVIPEDWETNLLGDVVEFLDSKRKPVKEEQRAKMRGIYPYYGASGIVDYVNDYLFDEDLILMGEDGENILSRNIRLVWQVSGKIWVNNHAHVLRPKSNFNIGFLTEYLESLDYSLYNSGTAQPKLNQQTCCNIVIALPPLPEQKAIASVLSDVDELISSLDKLIAKKRHIKTATMQQLLTGKTRLPGFGEGMGYQKSAKGMGYQKSAIGLIPEDWEVKQLGDVLKICHGKSQHHIISNNGIYPILGTGGEIGKTNTFLYNRPSVLIGRKGTIDAPIYIDTPFWTIDTLFYSQILSNANAKFIFYKFNLIDWYSYNEASGVPSLNAATIEDINQSFPPLPEQKAIASVLSDMDKEIAALEKRRAKTQAIKQGMMQELLTGRTRLIKP